MNGRTCSFLMPTGKACGRPACVNVPETDSWSCWIHAPASAWDGNQCPIPCRPKDHPPYAPWRPACVRFPGRCNYQPEPIPKGELS